MKQQDESWLKRVILSVQCQQKFCRHGRCGQSEGHGHTKNGEKESLIFDIKNCTIGQMIRKEEVSSKGKSKAKQGKARHTIHNTQDTTNERTPTLPLLDKSIAA